MIRVEFDKLIKRPIEEVFDRLINISAYSSRLPQSRVFRDSKQTSADPVSQGTTFIDVTSVGIFRGRVTEFQRPTRVAFRMKLRMLGMDVMESRPGYVLKPVDGGTSVHLLAIGKLYGLFKLIRPRVAKFAWRERTRVVEALKESLEDGRPLDMLRDKDA